MKALGWASEMRLTSCRDVRCETGEEEQEEEERIDGVYHCERGGESRAGGFNYYARGLVGVFEVDKGIRELSDEIAADADCC
jgi:hypothetical protein